MKELSIEEKAKRYDEVVAMAKECITHIPDEAVNKYMLNMFPELKGSEDERIRKAIHIYLDWLDGRKDYAPKGEYSIRDMIDWLEKQGEQKPVDKGEIKLKIEEGEWYVCISQFGNCVKGRVYKALSDSRIIDDFGTVYNMYSDAYKYFRLWTIEDAKDGDVLASKDGHDILIFKNLDTKTTFSSYYNIEHIGELGWSADYFIPATKEQQDLLFAKMKESNYEWNEEKKELKKIEQTVEIPFGAKDSELQEATYHIPEGYHAEINGNEVVIKKGETKFKEGDFIKHYKANIICKVISVNNGFYYVENIETSCRIKLFYAEQNFHLWTIEDAKEGDVLVASDGSIFIYKCQRNNSVVHYIAVTSCNDLEINENDYSWENKNVCNPATKEQRDTLFAKIKEDGYEWDVEKKELNKVTFYE